MTGVIFSMAKNNDGRHVLWGDWLAFLTQKWPQKLS
jgi:hypothetical protein